MKICSWNVNSLRARFGNVKNFLASAAPEIVMLQETKCQDNQFPVDALRELGYEAFFYGQKTYNGVATLFRKERCQLELVWQGFGADETRIMLCRDQHHIYYGNLYVPNGRSTDDPMYLFKLEWLHLLKEKLLALKAFPLVLGGDFNIALEEIDCHDPIKWQDSILFSKPEKQALNSLLTELDLVDSFRRCHPTTQSFSWWDYRNLSFPQNAGLRIDYLFVSKSLEGQIQNAWIERDERKKDRPSDHAPVLVELDPGPD